METRDWRERNQLNCNPFSFDTMDRYDPERDVTPEFVERVAAWIARSGEVLVVLRYLRAAGSKDFALCRTRYWRHGSSA